jgi:2-amino-4-hydroxy-6-hydroxymethyldihydropteridine diphosphokinase
MAKVYLSLGSNQGDRLLALVKATQLIDSLVGKVLNNSYLIESEPWGFNSEIPFYNIVLLVETESKPLEVLYKLLEIEKKLGRKREGKKYSNRTIDIDLLFYDQNIINMEELVVPHPYLHQRKFVLDPLFSIAPDFMHPIYNCSIKELFKNLADTGIISVKLQKKIFSELVKNTQ